MEEQLSKRCSWKCFYYKYEYRKFVYYKGNIGVAQASDFAGGIAPFNQLYAGANNINFLRILLANVGIGSISNDWSMKIDGSNAFFQRVF